MQARGFKKKKHLQASSWTLWWQWSVVCICSENQWTGCYMIGTSAVKELRDLLHLLSLHVHSFFKVPSKTAFSRLYRITTNNSFNPFGYSKKISSWFIIRWLIDVKNESLPKRSSAAYGIFQQHKSVNNCSEKISRVFLVFVATCPSWISLSLCFISDIHVLRVTCML